tara:strand:- start:220 stop:711 length:492 start_codon:yes stop_codon:yes gene_type:complete
MFQFKSVGKKITDRKFKVESPESLVTAIGIKTPLESGNDIEELYKVHTDPLEQLADNLRNLVQTNSGERLGRFEFGCNLKSILFDRNSSFETDYEKIATERIRNQVQKYLPLINIDDINFKTETDRKSFNRSSLAKVVIKVFFSVPKIRRMDNSIEVVLYNGG